MLKTAGAAIVEEQRAGLRIQPDHAEQECQIADARGDECLLRRRCGARFVIPEADEQIGGEADDLPAHKEQQQAVCDDDAQHRPCKERQKTEEAREVFIVGHVADAVDEDQQADERDHHQHHCGERIEHPAEFEPFAADLKPGKIEDLSRFGQLSAELKRLANATRESRNDRTMEPMATDAANLRFRCLARALRPAARTGIAGISQRFRTIQVMLSQSMVR